MSASRTDMTGDKMKHLTLAAFVIATPALADEYNDCLNRNSLAFNSYARFAQIDQAITGIGNGVHVPVHTERGVYGLHADMSDAEKSREAKEAFKQACRNNPKMDLRLFMEGAPAPVVK